MKTLNFTFKPVAVAMAFCAACAGPFAHAQSHADAPGPRLTPATQVAHAGTAALLASANAGQRLVAVGDHGVVMLSDDRGKSWRQAASVPVDCTLTGVSFVDAKKGWASGHWGVILSTTDGGEHWSVQRSASGEDRPLFAIHMFDDQRGVAVGLWSLVLVTADGGKTWDSVVPPTPEGAKKADLNLLGLFVNGKGELFATAERGTLLRSSDQGRTWRYLQTGYKGSFWTGVALKDGTLLAAGLRSSMYRSTDDGKSWHRIETSSTSSITDLRADAEGVLGVGLDGLILRSADAGASFKASIRTDHLPLTSVLIDASGQAHFFSRQGPVALGKDS